ncbi:hypothetical protein ETAA8_50960 [Anatilimnocola aggregata]|uniref:Uncharacterized protein n=1 Tax=Anatilimnocola aggregata TaxID=2528021 RepID=A0A517YID2_9BACT|nr:hypothetical protein [Anatilimnocola aggregata]QDU29978.1 hypothetical protein ETAA8_50960 [Anatilimnocola aggregata]
MNLPLWKKLVVVTVMMGFAGVASQPLQLLAQKAEAKAAAPAAKPKGRLPAYYKDLVTTEQKDKIYALQSKYDAQIATLADQIKTIQKQRDGEIEALLSAEQKAKLEKLRADAKAKAQEKAAARKAAAEKAGITAAVAVPAVPPTVKSTK